METTVGSAITPDYIGIIRPITHEIGLTISENKENGGEYYFYTTEDIEITNIEVKALFSGYTFNDDNILIHTPTWEENDSYTFSIGEIKKKGKNKSDGKYEHSVLIKLIDSPYIPNNSLNPLCLRLYIYYTLNGVDRRIKVDTKNPGGITDKGEHLVYHSNTYTKRKFWPYSIQLDSIYRPFFFNAALVFFDGDLLNNTDKSSEISGSTFARLYFSIANGCTIRDGVDEEGLPKYKIGDINLNINYLNKDGIVDPQSAYTLTIKDAYRPFSEIIEPGESGSTYYNAHIRGIRESGTKNIFVDYMHKDSMWGSTPGGMYLMKTENIDYLIPRVYDYTDLIPGCIDYYNKVYRSDGSTFVNDGNILSAHTFNIEHPLFVNFSVSDASIDGIDHKTIEVNCVDIRFPKNIEITNKGKVAIRYNDYNEEITYLCVYGEDTTVIDNIFKILGRMNVNDYTCDKYRDDDIFNYLYFKHYGKSGNKEEYDKEKVELLNFGYNAIDGIFEATPSGAPAYVIGVYHGGYEAGNNNDTESENDEETGDLLRYVNHTNKLLIMRIYKL